MSYRYCLECNHATTHDDSGACLVCGFTTAGDRDATRLLKAPKVWTERDEKGRTAPPTHRRQVEITHEPPEPAAADSAWRQFLQDVKEICR